MTDAPERIWACMGGPMVGMFVSGGNNGGWPEYVRADMVQSLPAERDRLREALRGLERASTEVASCGARTGPQWIKLTVANLRARAALKGESHE